MIDLRNPYDKSESTLEVRLWFVVALGRSIGDSWLPST